MRNKSDERKFGVHIVTQKLVDWLTNEPIPFDTLKYINRSANKIYGQAWVVTFENGYGASIIRTAASYGGMSGLFEVAVIHNGALCYRTPVTPDVLGYLTDDEVTTTLDAIAQLPRDDECSHRMGGIT